MLDSNHERIKALLELNLEHLKDLSSAKESVKKMTDNLWALWKAGIIEEKIHDAVTYYPNKVDNIIEEHKSKTESNSEMS